MEGHEGKMENGVYKIMLITTEECIMMLIDISENFNL